MDKPKLTFHKITTPITFALFSLLVLGVFFENILFFKDTVKKTFIDPPVEKVLTIDIEALNIISKSINIDQANMPILQQ